MRHSLRPQSGQKAQNQTLPPPPALDVTFTVILVVLSCPYSPKDVQELFHVTLGLLYLPAGHGEHRGASEPLLLLQSPQSLQILDGLAIGFGSQGLALGRTGLGSCCDSLGLNVQAPESLLYRLLALELLGRRLDAKGTVAVVEAREAVDHSIEG